MRSGFISIVGKPNVGKSTLLNRLVGEHLAGVSKKPQTTRGVVRGIVNTQQGQAVFLDTPGFHDPYDRLGEWMRGQIHQAMDGSDLIFWMVLPYPPRQDDEELAQELRRSKVPVFLLINQVDRVAKPRVLPVIDAYRKFPFIQEIIPISSLKGDNLPVVLRKTFETLPENPPFFPDDILTDQNERSIVSEIIREKVFRFTGAEIPYSSAIEIEEFKERSETLTAIRAMIVVEKDSQRKIVIGQNGQKIKEIGQAARIDLEQFLGKKVFLELWVKTLKNWKKDPKVLKRLGFE